MRTLLISAALFANLCYIPHLSAFGSTCESARINNITYIFKGAFFRDEENRIPLSGELYIKKKHWKRERTIETRDISCDNGKNHSFCSVSFNPYYLIPKFHKDIAFKDRVRDDYLIHLSHDKMKAKLFRLTKTPQESSKRLNENLYSSFTKSDSIKNPDLVPEFVADMECTTVLMKQANSID